MKRPTLILALAIALCAPIATPALAQNPASTAPTKLKAKTSEGCAHGHGRGDELTQD